MTKEKVQISEKFTHAKRVLQQLISDVSLTSQDRHDMETAIYDLDSYFQELKTLIK